MRCWSSSEEKSFADTFSASKASVASVMSLLGFTVLDFFFLLFFYFASSEAAVTNRVLMRGPKKCCLLVRTGSDVTKLAPLKPYDQSPTVIRPWKRRN